MSENKTRPKLTTGGGIIPTEMPRTAGIKHELDMWALISGFPVNLRYVLRFSTSRCIRPENVAEHSYYVCLYSFAIADWALRNDRVKFPELPDLQKLTAQQRDILSSLQKESFLTEVLTKATVHDLEEARSGDIHRPFKYSTPQLKGALDAAADAAFQQVVEQLFPFDDITKKGPCNFWLKLWSEAKNYSQPGLIVRFADYLSVLSYVLQEGPDATNRLCLDSMEGQFRELSDDKNYEFIRPLVDAAARLSKEVFIARRQAVNPG